MPLQETSESLEAIARALKSGASASQPSFLVVYASKTNGRSWCGDCRAAEPQVEKVFASVPQTVRVAYAGQQGEWRDPSNGFRQDPFQVTNLPTIIKVTADGEWTRLVEADVNDQEKLAAFVES
ncbi:hypothetical protein OIDMADRAFT_16173 [Oidiodendron maius Zn]|uniref:Thioredoxin domain-containing protein n=1 Tax=Oidiodendron maius (strain Zn) TaxID=913774 RepID=A0A0C3HX34_OIDMZ|nr:hypothetical protein OIDMADRAFT_16173 [Oidiodendron maius Zn]